MSRLRLLCLLPNLNGGGAERVMLYLCGGLDRSKFEVTLGLLKRTGPYVPLIPPHVETLTLGRSRGAYAVQDVARLFRSGRYDVSFSMVSMNLTAVLARQLSRSRIKLVLGARNHYSRSMPAEAGASRLKMAAIRMLYPHAEKVIAVSDGVAEDLADNFGIPRAKILAIHNPVDIDRIRDQARIEPNDPWLPARPDAPVLIAVGKLQPAKGYPDLIEAMALVRRETNARLLILGEGPDREAIEALIAARGLGDAVRLLGFKDDPYAYLARSTLFVHAAHWEGFPNVLAEAMACDLTLVSTDCPSGPAEIVTSGENGLLVPVSDPPALAAAVVGLLRDDGRRERMAANARASVERFRIERVVRRYAEVFEGVAARS